MKKILLLTRVVLFTILTTLTANSQNVFNPADPIIRWKSTDPVGSAANPDPSKPGLQKWVSVQLPSLGFDASSFKAYFSNLHGTRMAFRIKFPRSYNNPDSAGKKYPVMVFFHGGGELGCPSNGGIFNNEKHLLFGANLFKSRVDNNQFDGFLFYPQLSTTDPNCAGTWGNGINGYYRSVISVIDSLARYNRLDVDRVFTNGLSMGGGAAWRLTEIYPDRVAGAAPSAAAGTFNFAKFVHVPVWMATGGLDNNPSPQTAQNTANAMLNIGGNLRFSLFADQGHAVWNSHWNPSTYVTYMNSLHKANPLVFFQKNEFCADSAVDAKLGISPGFYAYEWQKDGSTIATSTNGVLNITGNAHVISFTGNEINVKSFGTYKVRFKRKSDSEWSVFSPIPAVIKVKSPTNSQAIQVAGIRSKVLPAPDGSTTVPLRLPKGHIKYEWRRVSDNALVSTDSVYTAAVGQYRARYYEAYNCGSNFSAVFTVVNANGSPKPSPATNLVTETVSQTSVKLTWTDAPAPASNETGYEIYRATTSGGPYTLIRITAANATTYTDNGLVQNTNYYYIIRAVNNTGAATPSNEALARTQIGNTAPVISAISNTIVKAGSTATINFTVKDSATDIVTVSIENKPAFITLQNISGYNYRITATPSGSHIGIHNLKVIARDNKNAESSRTFILTVSDENARTVLVNFGSSSRSAPAPWNNWLGSRGANSSLSNLKDISNVTTTFSITSLQSWASTTDMGHITGNNSGVYPDAVLASGISDVNQTREFRIGGLNPSMLYNIVLTGSQNEGLPAITHYASGNQAAQLNAMYNTQQTANLNGLVPDAAGTITITLTRVSPSAVMYLNAMAIEEYSSAMAAFNPVNLFAEAADRTIINLSWSDRAAAENTTDGYQLQRATDSAFTQNVATVNLARNTTTYRMTSLTPNTAYWFRIRSKTGTVFSTYSNLAAVITPATTVLVNFNSAVPSQAAPWNNTVANPVANHTFSNLKDQVGANSGISMRIEKVFNGEFNAGMRTGDNSGIVPDNVLQANYWLDKSQLSQIKVSGLNRARRYRFGFIGSSGPNGWFKGNYTATYTIGSRTVYLNSWSNTSKIVYIDNIQPDETGSVMLNFSTTSTAANGFNAAVIIHAYDVVGEVVPGEGKPPLANAGPDQTIKEPANTANIRGDLSSDPDGSITKYQWTKVSGDAAAWIENPNSVNTRIRSLKAGTYILRLTVTDNSNLTSSDDMIIRVLYSDGTSADSQEPVPPPPPPVNPPDNGQSPVANAGLDKSINLPANTVNLSGSGSTDPDGSIVKYEWTKVSGDASAWIENASAVNTRIRSLKQGTYVIRLKVTDNQNRTSTDDMTINVLPQRTSITAEGVELLSRAPVVDEQMTVFPNPAYDHINIRLADGSMGRGSINIYDITGKVIQKMTVTKNNNLLQQNINISSLHRGYYRVEVVIENKVREVKAFIKQ